MPLKELPELERQCATCLYVMRDDCGTCRPDAGYSGWRASHRTRLVNEEKRFAALCTLVNRLKGRCVMLDDDKLIHAELDRLGAPREWKSGGALSPLERLRGCSPSTPEASLRAELDIAREATQAAVDCLGTKVSEAKTKITGLEAEVNNSQRLLRLAAGFLMTTNARFQGLPSPEDVLAKLVLMLANLKKDEVVSKVDAAMATAEAIAKEDWTPKAAIPKARVEVVELTSVEGAPPEAESSMKAFEKDLITLLNRYSIENVVDMPDFLLAEMVCRMIEAVGLSVKKALDWHGCDTVCHPRSQPGQ